MTGVVTVKYGETILEVNYRFSTRARRISIRVDGRGMQLIIPKRISLEKGLKFLEANRAWLKRHMPLRQNEISYAHGSVIEILGERVEIIYTGSTAGITHMDGRVIKVFGREGGLAKSVTAMLIRMLQAEVEKLVAIKTAMIGVKCSEVKIKKLASMWGNCSPTGRITISSSLIHAPREVLEYIVSHEVAHLKEMNHSKRFWNTVGILMPEYTQARNWLKNNNHLLT